MKTIGTLCVVVNFGEGCKLEADRISFSFSFSVPKTAIFVSFGILFFGNKGLHTFGFILFFGLKLTLNGTENDRSK